MLPKQRRVGKEYFERIGKNGVSYHSPFFSVRILKSPEHKESKFSFTVSKKVSPGAVERNLLKRRGYSVVKDLLTKTQPFLLCAISIKKGAEVLLFQKFKEEIITLFKKATIINN